MAGCPPEQADVVLMVPLHDGQQVLAVLQGQLADVDQPLLVEGAQDGPPVAGHRGLLGLQGGVQAGVPQVGHRQGWHYHCTWTKEIIVMSIASLCLEPASGTGIRLPWSRHRSESQRYNSSAETRP